MQPGLLPYTKTCGCQELLIFTPLSTSYCCVTNYSKLSGIKQQRFTLEIRKFFFGKNYIVITLGFVSQKFFVATTQPYYFTDKAAIDNT